MSDAVFELPMLYGTASTGKTKTYKVYVAYNGDETYSILREHGQLGGKMQVDDKVVAEGKNLGRANETSVRAQAIMEAQSMWQKKVDAGYSMDQDADPDDKAILPMLAQPFKESKHRIVWPALGQAKLNGVRCLAERVGDKIFFTSRKGKSYDATLQHLVPDLLAVMEDGDVFDGEVYIHGKSLQTIVSYVKRLRPESAQLEYWIYDMAMPDMTFEQRYSNYGTKIFSRYGTETFSRGQTKLVLVGAAELESEAAMQSFHDTVVREGFEGYIIRNKAGLYAFNHRSADLQKYKNFIDEEFEITGGKTSATGRYEGCCIFICKAKNGEEFDVCPRGSVAIRKQYYTDLPGLIGKMLTVRYQNLSDRGIPLFPIGIVVRDYE